MKQGRWALDGNGAQDFLLAIPDLELELYRVGGSALLEGLKVVSVGMAFSKVKDTSQGMELQAGWRDAIEEFSLKYREPDMSVTPKVMIKLQK